MSQNCYPRALGTGLLMRFSSYLPVLSRSRNLPIGALCKTHRDKLAQHKATRQQAAERGDRMDAGRAGVKSVVEFFV